MIQTKHRKICKNWIWWENVECCYMLLNVENVVPICGINSSPISSKIQNSTRIADSIFF